MNVPLQVGSVVFVQCEREKCDIYTNSSSHTRGISRQQCCWQTPSNFSLSVRKVERCVNQPVQVPGEQTLGDGDGCARQKEKGGSGRAVRPSLRHGEAVS